MCNGKSLASCLLCAFGSPLSYYSDPSAPSRTSFATISPLYSRAEPMRLPAPSEIGAKKRMPLSQEVTHDLRMKTYLEPAYVSSPLRVFRAEARGPRCSSWKGGDFTARPFSPVYRSKVSIPPQSLATFSIASLGESNWCVTRPQEGHKYPSIILTSPMIGIPLWRRKSMVRVIP